MARGIKYMRIFGKSFVLSIACLFCIAAPAYALDVTLQWDANTESNLDGYKIYYRSGASGGGVKGNYNGTGATEGNSPIDMSLNMDENSDPNVVEFTVHGLNDGQTFDVPRYDAGQGIIFIRLLVHTARQQKYLLGSGRAAYHQLGPADDDAVFTHFHHMQIGIRIGLLGW